MKWFKRKSKSKSKSVDVRYAEAHTPRSLVLAERTPPIPRSNVKEGVVANLPAPVLRRLFSFICPHAGDETYEACEQSLIEDGCMLCDLRDLSHCAQACKSWRRTAIGVLYHSIRLDTVHYCEREDLLADTRRRISHRDPEDPAQSRLILLCRTLRDDTAFGLHVQFLKIPYMTRESSKPEIARTVAVCPNLRYIDLPNGFYTDDYSANPLIQEVQARCPDLRKMTYKGGSERSLAMLASGTMWRKLEVLELLNLDMDVTIIRRALGALPQLHAMKVTNMKLFHDDIFSHSDYLPPFPALTELVLDDVANITTEGISDYLFRSDVQESLKTLSFTETGVLPSSLYQILATAPKLQHLSIVEAVSSAFPGYGGIPGLQSNTLETFHFEITSKSSGNKYHSTTESYYNYLRSSLMSGGLPNLKELYVIDPKFPETLTTLAPPRPGFALDPDNFVPPKFGSPENKRFSSNNPFAKMAQISQAPGISQELEVYTKDIDETDWNFSIYAPPPTAIAGRRGSGSGARPTSSYGLDSISKPWHNAGARKSVIVGNGFGGFLAVSDDTPERPRTSSGEHFREVHSHRKRASQIDIWR